MNPKAQHAASSSARFSHVAQASRLRSWPNPAGGTPALPSSAPLSSISYRSPVESCAFYSIRLLSSERRAAAFTLLEVLVASAIMGIVMFVLVSTANTSMQLWRNSSEKIAVDREGRTGLSILAWDLQNLIQPQNTNLRPKLQTNGNADIPLRFLTLKPSDYQNTNTDFGDVCFVEYRYSNYAILRRFVGSAATFASLRNGELPTNNVQASEFQVLATNVWQFRVWGHQSTSQLVEYNDSGDQRNYTNQLLRSIEYRVEAYDSKYMQMYRDNPQLAQAQGYKSRKYFQAIQPVPPPNP
jgi:prepilin-type N-terminal cleavage/methylation domain-containing protein